MHFRGEPGSAYQFRVTAVDRATNRAAVETGAILIPVDDRDRRLWRFSRGWKRAAPEERLGRARSIRATRKRARTAALRFRGRRVALIGRRLPKGGRVRVTVGRQARKVCAARPRRPDACCGPARRLSPAAHTLRVRTLGGRPVELDAVAPLP